MLITHFTTSKPWNANRPRVLVVACSDGRLQQPLDEFLQESLGIDSYDRLYLPGGPGALSPYGVDFMRAARSQEELKFLLKAHQIEQVILTYHGAAPGGPMEANCADYQRIYLNHTTEEIRRQQQEDTDQILRSVLGEFPRDHIEAYRLEVTRTLGIQVHQLA